jgi:aspartate/methionine/tyrosine aminotransferase
MPTNKKFIAQRLNQFDSSAIRKAFELNTEIPDPIDLSIGFPEDDTPDYIKAAAIRAIKSGDTRYTPSNGSFALRGAIAEKLNRENNIFVENTGVSVTPGVTTAILLAYLAILDPGDEILIPDPFFPPYRDLAILVGAKPVLMDTFPSFQLTAELIEPHITKNTKAIIINSPNNPTGAVYPQSELLRIAKLAKRHDIAVISDEVYEHFAYDVPHFSIGSVYPKTITLNGFSKSYAMTGWRVGYIAGPMEAIEAINELQQYIVFSSSSVSQRAALSAFRHTPLVLTRKYRSKRDLAVRLLKRGFEVRGAHGAFYAFVQLPPGADDLAFTRLAAREKVIILPGRAFSKRGDYIRIAFAAPRATITKGIPILTELAEQMQNSVHIIN